MIVGAFVKRLKNPLMVKANTKSGSEELNASLMTPNKPDTVINAAMEIIKNNSWLMLFVLFTCFSLKSHVSFGADTISANQSLSGDQTIVSKGGVFAFGFFNPAPGKSSNYYIGMWYNKVSERTIVWGANREQPVSDRFSSVLRISDGNLILFNESQLPIWSTNLTATSRRSVVAVLLDEGNLVLRDLSNNLSEQLWRSFDHPAHTWIPGMKLTFNKRNNVSQLLTSWKNKENPAPGLFSLELAPDGSNQNVILWNRSEQYWRSGPWDDNAKIFTLVPEMTLNYIYNFSYVSNENESYFTYNVKDSTYTSRFIMDVSGQCENNSPANGKSDQFFLYSNMKLPKHPQKFVGLQQLQGGRDTIYIKLAASEFESPKNNKGVVIGSVVGSVAVVALICLIMLVYLRRRKTATVTTETLEGSLVAFAYKDLQTATKNFSEKLGGGGFGSVFKGVFPNSNLTAVKKIESWSQGEKQFRTEVSTIGNVQHVNLVRLLGFCSELVDFHDWKTRYQNSMGTARGLAYLHEKCRDCIIHCDITPENILLDAEFCPKVSDFGLAKLVGREFSRVLTTMRGTRGYLAPEWISGVAITAKTDVYSYGMMLFEFVSGRRSSQESEDGKVKFFPSWAAKRIVEGSNLVSLLDPRLEGNADEEELARLCKVAC
ncbi:G-type lectin S-receptor-like serine/threonine-protein kinase [Citrus sinensis]|uniref:G-type lectin S-receptor-like serine/threonine-protein kinase n=1 Tax=Citrus sinensis TaxID=2711 RepID=A0ACB8N425_CITSI|nr:G-type lectin S-receptor-like serine/threonine-protein kinase [Citrus sinensis]